MRGYDFWLNVLNYSAGKYRGLVCSFLTSESTNEVNLLTTITLRTTFFPFENRVFEFDFWDEGSSRQPKFCFLSCRYGVRSFSRNDQVEPD